MAASAVHDGGSGAASTHSLAADDLGSDEIEAFATAMWAPGFAVSVTRDQVRSFRTPMLVLPGVDEYHPAETGREIAALAPAAGLLEPWKDPEHLPAATEAVRVLRAPRQPQQAGMMVTLSYPDAPSTALPVSATLVLPVPAKGESNAQDACRADRRGRHRHDDHRSRGGCGEPGPPGQHQPPGQRPPCRHRTEHFQIVSASISGKRSPVVIYGAFNDRGVDVTTGNTTDSFRFPGGSFRVTHKNTSSHQHFSTRTCAARSARPHLHAQQRPRQVRRNQRPRPLRAPRADRQPPHRTRVLPQANRGPGHHPGTRPGDPAIAAPTGNGWPATRASHSPSRCEVPPRPLVPMQYRRYPRGCDEPPPCRAGGPRPARALRG